MQLESCLAEKCITDAKIKVEYTSKPVVGKLRVGSRQFLMCVSCPWVKTGLVFKAGEGAPCVKCIHNPNSAEAAKPPEFFL